jgi:hypothetical protein
MLIKLVNEKRNDWDEHLGVVLFTYCTTYEVSTIHTPFQLVYGLYSLMPTKYLLPTFTSEGIVVTNIVKVLTKRIFELEKLEETRLEAIENIRE